MILRIMGNQNNDVLADAWRSFHEDRNIEARNQLVLHYTALVRMVAAKIGQGLPSMVDRDDLVSYGTFGLINVLETFDPERGVKFETYATPRIRGSILDELRKIDWAPRSIRAKARDIERVRTELHAELSREPLDEEIANRLNISLHDLWSLRGQVHGATVATLDGETGRHDGDETHGATTHGDFMFDPASNPEDLLENAEITQLVADAINAVDAKHKTILVLYYVQEMTLSEIGKVLGVTESRVCQLQSKALTAVREALGHYGMSAAA